MDGAPVAVNSLWLVKTMLLSLIFISYIHDNFTKGSLMSFGG
jgi:hypothetical protein